MGISGSTDTGVTWRSEGRGLKSGNGGGGRDVSCICVDGCRSGYHYARRTLVEGDTTAFLLSRSFVLF